MFRPLNPKLCFITGLALGLKLAFKAHWNNMDAQMVKAEHESILCFWAMYLGLRGGGNLDHRIDTILGVCLGVTLGVVMGKFLTPASQSVSLRLV